MRKLAIVMVTLWGIGLFSGGIVPAAEKYPTKPIVYIVPLEAGAGGDMTSRALTQKAQALLGQPVMIVNKPGGGSSIGYRELHNARPDGYTIGTGMATIVTNKLQGLLPYDHNDFTILGVYATYNPIIVASTKTQRQFKTIGEVLAYAKAHPGELSMATSGIGQSWWIATMAFLEGTGLNFNVIPQPGAGAYAIAQVAGGHTDLGMVDLVVAKPQIEAGNVRFLAVYGPKRAPGYENVPTLKEVGLDMTWDSTHVVLGPPNLPPDITAKLVKTVEELANGGEFKKFLTERYGVPFYLPPEQAIQYFDKQREICRYVMVKAGILKEK
jgi:tripartite-type tricarboxylate transporter receptor subunit TctC